MLDGLHAVLDLIIELAVLGGLECLERCLTSLLTFQILWPVFRKDSSFMAW